MKKCIMATALVFLVSTATGSGEWLKDWINPLPTRHLIKQVWVSPEGSAIAVGISGMALHRHEQKWISMNTHVKTQLNSVWGVSSSDVFAVGDAGVIIRFDGSNWWLMKSGTTKNLLSISGYGSNNGVAVGTAGTILHWNGIEWQSMQTPATGDFHDVWWNGSDIGFALSYDGIYRWDGASWNFYSDDLPLECIGGSGIDNLYLGGGYYTFDLWSGFHYYGQLFKFDGSSFRSFYNADSYSDSVAIIDIASFSSDCLFFCQNGANVNKWNGSSFIRQDAFGYGVAGSSSDDVYSFGGNQICHWDGNSWENVSRTFGEFPFSAVWKTDDDSLVIASNLYYRSPVFEWDGSFLTEMPGDILESVDGLWGTDSASIYAVGNGINDQTSIIHWNGISWMSVTDAPVATLHDIWGFAADDIFVVGDSGKTYRYNGSSWTFLQTSSQQSLRCIWGESSDNVYAAGDQGALLNWNGTMWLHIQSGTDYNLSSITGAPDGKIFIAGSKDESSIVLLWNGTQWITYPPIEGTINEIRCVDDNSALAVCDNGKILQYLPTAIRTIPCGNTELTTLTTCTGNSTYLLGSAGELLQYTRTTGVSIELAANLVHPYNQFWAAAYVDNATTQTIQNIPFALLLDVMGFWYSYPDWQNFNPADPQSLSLPRMTFPVGTTALEIFPEFTWPDTGSDHLCDIIFYGALLTEDMTNLIGDIAMVSLAYGP